AEFARGSVALPAQIEAQIREVARLALAGPASGLPHPRLFDALSRLEEMVPRTPATRRAQLAARQYFTRMVTRHSQRMAREWPAVRERAERAVARDRGYARLVDSIDRRLREMRSGAPPPPAADGHPSLEPVAAWSGGLAAGSVTGGAAAGPAPASHFPFESMRPGDIMVWNDKSGPPMVRFALAMFAENCTHTAIYLGATKPRTGGVQHWILEAQSPSLGVRTSIIGKKWTRAGLHVSLGHVNGIPPARAEQLAMAALSAYGADGRTPYHTWPPWDKSYCDDGLYCSQLIWVAYKQAGIDLDSNDWHYLVWFSIHNWWNPYAASTAYSAVFPDEIKASPHITWYYDQSNPKPVE
ncbi:MAG TPA: hypothetical protein VKT77_05515, partial [Chthonomonadaceae bacterium]|nr:hypothetical protein [Chthonomonadaceae bacterium]